MFTDEKELCETIRSFRLRHSIPTGELSRRTGISPANISMIETGKTALTMVSLVRIVTAMWTEDVQYAIFPKNVLSCLEQRVTRREIFSVTDFAALSILLTDFLCHQNKNSSAEILEGLFYEMLNPASATLIRHEKPDDSVLSLLIQTFFTDSSLGYTLPAPDNSSLRFYDFLLHKGGTIYWSDIATLISAYRRRNSLTLQDLSCPKTIARLESLSPVRGYKVRDILDLDQGFDAGGVFFALVFTAVRNSLLLKRIITVCIENADPAVEKVEKGLFSFLGLLRLHETSTFDGNLLALTSLRSAASSDYFMTILDQLILSSSPYFPMNPLRFYH